MKKVEIIIKAEKLEDLKSVFSELEITGLMLTNIMGYGNQKGYTQMYRGTKYTVNLLPKLRGETVIKDSLCEVLIEKVLAAISTGNIGDGKIFVSPVEDAVRIRTGERGESAI